LTYSKPAIDAAEIIPRSVFNLWILARMGGDGAATRRDDWIVSS
jgi:hypothetical protein